ncbi:MAG: hypothetical protein AAB436_01605 [Patescibacteria group bacterium]
MKTVTRTKLALPILDKLPPAIYSLGVPISGDHIPVGFLQPPDDFDRLAVAVEPNIIEIHRESGDPIQIGAKTLLRREEPQLVLAEPVDFLLLLNHGDGWMAKDSLADPATRVGLSRFVAKIGEAIMNKSRDPDYFRPHHI